MVLPHRLIDDQLLRIDLLAQVAQRPALFAPGVAPFWDDPYISEQMLAAHLNPQIDAASRAPEVIARTVEHLVAYLGLRPGQAVLDLGCGPGLYCAQLAGHGLRVTGVDYARRSIAYARDHARAHDLAIDYVYQDYLTIDYHAQFDAVMLIYGDYGVLAPDQRARLLERVHRALKPGGAFVLDLITPVCRENLEPPAHWYVAERGFWRGEPHLVLEQGFSYPDAAASVRQYLVLDQRGVAHVYRTWTQHYTPETIRGELSNGRFVVEALWADLTGAAYAAESAWIGVVARRG